MPPSGAAAAVSAGAIAVMPASNTVTPSPSSAIRYTFIVAREAAADDPDAVGDRLGVGRLRPARRRASWH